MKLTQEQWQKLTREEQRQAIIEFREPQFIVNKEKYINLQGEKI